MLRAALPLLRDAESIWILDTVGRARRDFMPSDAALYLERHGFDAYELETEGDCLAEIVAGQDIDLVVGAAAQHFLSAQPPERIAEELGVPLLVAA